MQAPLRSKDIAELIPHTGNMVLLDEINQWDNNSITATAFSKAPHDNPLLEESDNYRFDSMLLIEYGAQAAAVHAALLSSGLGEQRPAYIGAVKNVAITQPNLDPTLTITINASMLLANANGAIYDIECQQNQTTVISAKLILNQPA